MLSRRSFTVLLLGAVATSAPAMQALADDSTYEKLFFIQRSKNANEVHYDARVSKDGTLDRKKPVVGYWINKATDGGRESIGLLERIAYGHDVEPAPDGKHVMRLSAFKERPLTLLRVNGKWRAQTVISGKAAYLQKLHVAADESGVTPTVLYVNLYGEEVGTGNQVKEHIKK